MCGNTELRTNAHILAIPVAARYTMWVCGRSLAEIVGSNAGGVMDVCCECWVLSLTECGREAPQKTNKNYNTLIIKKKSNRKGSVDRIAQKYCGSFQIADFHHGVLEHSGSAWIRN